MTPFDYPAAAHVRRHGPQGYANYESYRPWVRDEFVFRCVYCLLREMWGPLIGVYAIDHFHPIISWPELELEYDNLLYGCVSCNLSKGSLQTPDPLSVLLDSAVKVAGNGEISATTRQARKLIDQLGLNRPRLCEFRQMWIRIVRLAALHESEVHQQLMQYPTDLPDLGALRPPKGNTRPDGIAQSHLSRQQRGELPKTY